MRAVSETQRALIFSTGSHLLLAPLITARSWIKTLRADGWSALCRDSFICGGCVFFPHPPFFLPLSSLLPLFLICFFFNFVFFFFFAGLITSSLPLICFLPAVCLRASFFRLSPLISLKVSITSVSFSCHFYFYLFVSASWHLQGLGVAEIEPPYVKRWSRSRRTSAAFV